jgi:hypothetical protein
VYGSFGNDVGVEAVAEIDRIYVVAFRRSRSAPCLLEITNGGRFAYHSRSLYIIVKNTCRKRLTAFISTAKRYSHASPDMLVMSELVSADSELLIENREAKNRARKSCSSLVGVVGKACRNNSVAL